MPMPRFDAVDAIDPSACIVFLDLAHSLPGVERWKRFSHDLLRIREGDKVLDIGCGTGADAVALARRVGIRGKVVGVDLSEAMVTVAAARAEPLGLPVVFHRADIHDLPFADGSFDATRIDRVLHFLPDPARALREAARITVPGGCIVITEPDWGSLQISGGDAALTAVIAEAGAGLGSEARIGPSLPRLLAEAGLLPTGSHAASLELCDYAAAAALFGLEALATRAVASGRVSGGEAVGWLRSLRLASAEGGLRCALGGVIASAIRPATPSS